MSEYAKCLDGQEGRAKRLIEKALNEPDEPEAGGGEEATTT